MHELDWLKFSRGLSNNYYYHARLVVSMQPVFLEPVMRQFPADFTEEHLTGQISRDIDRIIDICKSKISQTTLPHTVVGAIKIVPDDPEHHPWIVKTYADHILLWNLENEKKFGTMGYVPVYLYIKETPDGVAILAGIYEPLALEHIDALHFAPMAESLNKGQAAEGKADMPMQSSASSAISAVNIETEIFEPLLISKIELSEQNLEAIRKALKENYSAMLKEMKNLGVDEIFPPTLEECTKLQQLQILSWALVAPNDKWKNKLGQTYKLTQKNEGVKSPDSVFSSMLGDCDDFAVLFSQAAKQLGLMEGVQVFVITIDEQESTGKGIIGHANLLLNMGGKSHIFDLTHIPPFREFGKEIKFKELASQGTLKRTELEIANAGRNEDRISKPEYRFFPSPESYYHHVSGARYFEARYKTGKLDLDAAKNAEYELKASGLKDFKTKLMLGTVQIDIGGEKKLEEAVANLGAALKLAPKDYSANYGMGLALSAMSKYGEAVKYEERAYDADKKSLNNLRLLAVGYSMLAVPNYAHAINAPGDVKPEEFQQRLSIAAKYMKYSGEGYNLAAAVNDGRKSEFEKYHSKAVLLHSYELVFQGRLEQVDIEGVKAAALPLDREDKIEKQYIELRDYVVKAVAQGRK